MENVFEVGLWLEWDLRFVGEILGSFMTVRGFSKRGPRLVRNLMK